MTSAFATRSMYTFFVLNEMKYNSAFVLVVVIDKRNEQVSEGNDIEKYVPPIREEGMEFLIVSRPISPPSRTSPSPNLHDYLPLPEKHHAKDTLSPCLQSQTAT